MDHFKRGVKTQEGKEISKYNAVRHGILVQTLLPEELEAAETIRLQLMSEYAPKTLTEELLIETIVVAYTRRHRATQAELDFIKQIYNPAVYEEIVITAPLLNNPLSGDTLSGIKERIIVKEAYRARVSPDEVDTIDKTFARYINTCERQLFRALHELQRIQSIRKGLKPTSVAIDLTSERGGED